jgi:MYXO-CTERM domain-containing protein
VGVFPAIVRVMEVGGGSEYDVVSLLIGANGGYASFGFDRAFVSGPGQTMARLTLVPSGPGSLGIAPEALVPGTHVVSSVLFGTVTVTVVPEQGSAGLLVVAALLAGRRRRGDGCAVG